MSTSDKEVARQLAAAGTLVDVCNAVEAWAKRSTTGSVVWDVGSECIPDVWAYWCAFLRDHSGHAHRCLIATLEDIARGCSDACVSAAIESATAALKIDMKPSNPVKSCSEASPQAGNFAEMHGNNLYRSSQVDE